MLTLMSGVTCGAAAGSCTDGAEPASPSTRSGLIRSLLLSPHFICTQVLSPRLHSAFIPAFTPYTAAHGSSELMANLRTTAEV